MAVVAFLRRLVVIGTDQERAVGADALGEARQADGLAGAVGAGAGHHLDPARRPLADGGDDALVLLMVQGRRLAGGTHGGQAVGALLDVPIDQLEQRREVDLPVAERRDQRDGQAGEHFSLGGHRGAVRGSARLLVPTD